MSIVRIQNLQTHFVFLTSTLPNCDPSIKSFLAKHFLFLNKFLMKNACTQHLTSGQTLAIVRPISTNTNTSSTTTMRDYSRRVTYNDRTLRGTARTGIIQPIIVVILLILSLVAQAVPSFGARGRASLGPDKLGAEL